MQLKWSANEKQISTLSPNSISKISVPWIPIFEQNVVRRHQVLSLCEFSKRSQICLTCSPLPSLPGNTQACSRPVRWAFCRDGGGGGGGGKRAIIRVQTCCALSLATRAAYNNSLLSPGRSFGRSLGSLDDQPTRMYLCLSLLSYTRTGRHTHLSCRHRLCPCP